LGLGIALLLLLGLMLPVASDAAGSPDISVSVEGPATLLYGTPATVTLLASNPAGQPYGYNLSFRAVLPAGISYQAGTSQLASGAAVGEPETIHDEPATNETTLIWRNVSDLSPASHNSLSFKLAHSTSTLAVGATYTVNAGAYIASEERFVPKFEADGTPEGPKAGSFTGEATGSEATRLTAIQVTQEESTEPEGEILRGVHDHQVVYRLKVTNTSVNPSSGATLDDWLPADLEYLGCGGAGADNTKDAPTNPGSAFEYPGSGAILVAALGGCVAPALVETASTDPDGAGEDPAGVYTHLHWSIGTLGAGETKTFEFRAAVPLRENTMTWTGATPTAASGHQGANLDNNSGTETIDGESILTFAEAKASYDSELPVTASGYLSRTAKDITTEKSADSDSLGEGHITHWTILVHSSEYRYQTGVVVTDTLPNGMCPLSSTNLATGSEASECAPTGEEPSSPFASAVEASNGTWALTWNDGVDTALARLAQNATTTITFSSRTRSHYQSGHAAAGPILANDSVTNHVLAEGSANVVCANDTDCSGEEEALIYHERTPPEALSDTSSAGQSAAGPTIEKAIAESGPGCEESDTFVTSVPVYHPGDVVCWRLEASFPAATDTKGLQITDFLPSSVLFDAGFNGGKGELETEPDTLPETTFNHSEAGGSPGGVLAWTLPESGVVPSAGQRFERIYETTATLPVGTAVGELQGNLMKFANLNTPGESFSQRSEANFELEFPKLSLAKQVVEVGGNPITPASSATVKGGQEAVFALTLSNSGGVAASGTEVWDELPAGLKCTDIVAGSISDRGSCSEGAGRISWGETGMGQEEVTVPALGQTVLHFTVVVPATIDPATTLKDLAGVRKYTTPTNTSGTFEYIPEENIDPLLASEENISAAGATASLVTEDVKLTKTNTSSIVEGATNTLAQATIGEEVTFEVVATIPAGTTLSGVAKLTDPGIPTERLSYQAGSVKVLVNKTTAPAGFEAEDGSGSPVATFPENYAAGAAPVEVAMSFRAIVTKVAANIRGTQITNTGKLTWVNPISSTTETRQATDEVPIVEPSIGLAETNDSGGKRVHGGQLVKYELTLTNAGSTAWDNTVVDTIPEGLTPSDSGGVALANGASTASGGVWNASARTITWSLAKLEGGSEQVYPYFVTVNASPVSAKSLTDSAIATTSSLSGGGALERTAANAPNAATKKNYEAPAGNTLVVEGATVTKASDSLKATIGHRITYTLTVTLPANVVAYDETVIDTLPDTLDFDQYVSATCVEGCPPETAPTVQTYKPAVAGATTVAWYFGELTATAHPRVIKLVYVASVRATHRSGGARVEAPTKIENSATLYYDQSSKKTFEANTIPAPGSFDQKTTPPAIAKTTVVEPVLGLTKEAKVDAGAYFASPATPAVTDGDTVSYRLRTTNTGTSPAYSVVLADTVPSSLVEVTATTGSSQVTKAWTAGSPEIRWTLTNPIAVGETVEVGYQAKLGSVTTLKAGQEIKNAATISSYFGVSPEERAEALKNFANEAIQYREYTGPSAQVTLKVALPTISITKTTGGSGFPASANAEVGQPFTWRVVVKDTSTVAAKSVQVTDTLPANWEYVANSAAFSLGGSIEPTVTGTLAAGLQLSWNTGIELAAGQATTLTYQAKPILAAESSPGSGSGHPNLNKASAAVKDLAGNSADADGAFAAGPAQAQGILVLPGLELSKTPAKASAAAGEADSYTVHVHNAGEGIAHEVVVVDTLPAGMTYVAKSATASPSTGFSETAATSSSITWAITAIAVGANVNITVPVGTVPTLASGTALINKVAVHSVEQPTPVSASGTITTTTSADLLAEKHVLGGGPATPGEHMTYVVAVTNDGPSTARAVELSDHLPAAVQFVSAEAGCTQSAGTVTCKAGDLEPTQKASFQIVVSVPSSVTANIDNIVHATSTTPDPVSANNEANVEVPAHPRADLRLLKSALTPEVLDGQHAVFSLLATNAGPSDAAAATIVEDLPSGLTYVSASGASCSAAAQKVTCLLGTLAAGAHTTVELTVLTTGAGTRHNSATVSSTAEDPEPLNNTSEATVQVLAAADLVLEKTVAPAVVELPGEVTYTLRVTNNGPDGAVGAVLTDPLPSGETYMSDDGGCTALQQTVTCQLGELANGATRTIHLHVRVGVSLGEQMVTNTAQVASVTGDANAHNNVSAAVIETGPAADLALVKSGPASVLPGGQIAWALTVTDRGPSTAHLVTVADPLPAGAAYESSAPSQGSCAYASGRLTCELGTLAAGASAQITLTATVTAGPGSLQNMATVSGEEPDPEPANNTASATTSIVAAPDPPAADPADPPPAPTRVTLRKVVREHAVSPGGALDYRLTVRDAGTHAAERLLVCDRLPEHTSVLSRGHGHLSGGRICFTLATLAAGHSHAFTIVLRADSDAGGLIVNRAVVSGVNFAAAHASATTQVTGDGADPSRESRVTG
jgi:uncharacterized repeat protein (TIGR01451 family)/fimbrial isopeptide formation D2 family protein